MKPPVAVEVDDAARQRLPRRLGQAQEAGASTIWRPGSSSSRRSRTSARSPSDIKAEDVVKNDLVAGANNFDKAKVKADADGYKLSDDYTSIDVEAIRKAL